MSRGSADYYSDLGVSQNATLDEIKAVYRSLAKIYHPDINPDAAGTEKFRRITAAYEVLSVETSRAAYDRSRGSAAGHKPSAPSETGSPPPQETTEFVCCSACKKVTAQPRFVTFRSVASFILATNTKSTSAVYCSSCASSAGLRASAISAAFGWWGVPWGPLLTIKEIVVNALGGTRNKQLDDRLMWQNAIALFERGQLPLALSLARTLRSSQHPQIAAHAERLAALLMSKNVKMAELKSSWGAVSPSWFAQIVLAAIVPLAITLVVILSDKSPSSYTAATPAASTAPSRPVPAGNVIYNPLVGTVATPPSRPVLSLDTPPIAREAEAPAQNLCANIPENGEVLAGNFRSRAEGHRLVIMNGSEGRAIVKIRRADNRKLVASFFVDRNATGSLNGISDGSYVIQFALGDAMTRDCKSLIDAVASEFDEVQRLTTNRTRDQIVTQELSFTLYNVAGGNIQPIDINVSDFDAD